jgi:hypothetical protein
LVAFPRRPLFSPNVKILHVGNGKRRKRGKREAERSIGRRDQEERGKKTGKQRKKRI